MSELTNQSLQRIAKGTGIVFIGSLVGLFLAFIGRVIVARYWTESDYGIFSLALVVLNIAVVISTLGLQQGVTRNIAYARGKDKSDTERVQTLISSSLRFGLLASVGASVVLYFSAELLATRFFHTPELVVPLKLFAFGVPFLTLIDILVAVFRGFSDVRPTAYFYEILRNLLFPIGLVVVILLNVSFTGIFYALLASLIVTCIVLVVYTVKRLPSSLQLMGKGLSNHVSRELLVFSLPLLGVSMLNMIIGWTDTVMLGWLKTSVDVGLYNVAHPLAHFISFPLTALLLIYTPVISVLYAQNSMDELRRNFAVLTKWLCALTLPLFLILFLFPDLVISFLFGAPYAPAATALRILSLGFIISNILGPNGATLTALGEVRFLMLAAGATAMLNIVLNAVLIPQYGIAGAAVASVVSLVSINCIKSWKLFSVSKAQPLSKNLLKPTVVSLVLVILIYVVVTDFLMVTFWLLPLFFVMFYGVYGVAMLITKSFDQEDIEMLLAIERKTGVDAASVKKILKRFL